MFPSLDLFLEWAEKHPIVLRLVVKLWGYLAPSLQSSVLRRVNPQVTHGALAVIIDPYSEKNDPKVLLGWHSYRASQKIPWALLGGALKKRDEEWADPAKTVTREVREETNLDIEVVKLLAIDTDWPHRTTDFFFECVLRHGPDLEKFVPSPEIARVDWFRISELPENMYAPHRRFLTQVLTNIPQLPGASWTANQERPKWWDRLSRAEQLRQRLSNSTENPMDLLYTLVEGAQDILSSEVVGLFVTEPPIRTVSSEFLPADIGGHLRLLAESSELHRTNLSPSCAPLPLSPAQGEKLGLTVGLLHEKPLGRAIRLHDDWLHKHRYVKSWTGHRHLRDGECKSMLAVAVLSQNRVLGLLKAENKFRGDFATGPWEDVPFAPDDGYILEQLASTAASLLQRFEPGKSLGA
jgi:8-oxo-dGTP pyrophosphatase MutT (NUDIX family)